MVSAWSLNCRAKGMGGGISLLLFNPNGAVVFSCFLSNVVCFVGGQGYHLYLGGP